MLILKDSIAQAESKWLERINRFIVNVYQNIHLPSHDIAHHLRVWNFCKDILKEHYNNKEHIDPVIVEEALVSCLFHDTGLTIEKSENHGYQSKLICKRFFENNKILSDTSLERVLKAIEYHDDKSIRRATDPNDEHGIDLINLVSTADDLDAFGLIGVFRYIEIYTIRGVSLTNLPSKVLINLENRFNNFKNFYLSYPKLFEKHKLRYMNIFNFFQQLDNELKFTSENRYAQDVTQILIDNLIKKQSGINKIISEVYKRESNERVKFFFEGLKQELDYF